MGSIALEGLEFFAYHGVYEEEQRMGNKYSVDITVGTSFEEAALEDRIGQTIDYGTLYQIVKKEMESPAKLLETLAVRIINNVFTECPKAEEVKIAIAKYNPPIGGVCTRAKVELVKKRIH